MFYHENYISQNISYWCTIHAVSLSLHSIPLKINSNNILRQISPPHNIRRQQMEWRNVLISPICTAVILVMLRTNGYNTSRSGRLQWHGLLARYILNTIKSITFYNINIRNSITKRKDTQSANVGLSSLRTLKTKQLLLSSSLELLKPYTQHKNA